MERWPTLEHDIAVVELKSPFAQWSKTLKPACLDIDEPEDPQHVKKWDHLLTVSFECSLFVKLL